MFGGIGDWSEAGLCKSTLESPCTLLIKSRSMDLSTEDLRTSGTLASTPPRFWGLLGSSSVATL